MTLHAPSRVAGLGRRALAALVVVGAAVFVGGVAAAPAQAAPFEFVVSSGIPDFSYQKAGGTQIRTFDLLNSGDNDITIDPAPLAALAAPFAASAISFTKTTVIPKNGHGTFTVTYSVPALGTVSSVPVTLVATDQTDNAKLSLALTFKGTAIATDPAHYTATTLSGAAAVDFGTVKVGQSAKQTVKLTVDGVEPIRFSTGDIKILDSAGNPVPSVMITASSFGSAGAVTDPGAFATFELTYTPTLAGGVSGNARIGGFAVSGSVETSAIVVDMPFAGAATAVIPPTPPTTPPTTPSAGTPIPTVTATTGGSQGGGGGNATHTGSLAETGVPAVGMAGLGLGAGVLGFGALAGLVVARRRAQKS